MENDLKPLDVPESREALMRLMTQSDGQMQTSVKQMLGEGYQIFRDVMRRLSSEYTWEMTKEDGQSWAEFARCYDVNDFRMGIAAHLADQTMTSLGTPACTFRPKIGQIAGHIERIVKRRDEQRTAIESQKKFKQWREEASDRDQVAVHMQEMREKFPRMFKGGGSDDSAI